MARFYFHVREELDANDPEGQELEDLAAAKAEAMRGARDLAADQVRRGYLNLQHRIDIEDDEFRPVATISFGDVVSVHN